MDYLEIYQYLLRIQVSVASYYAHTYSIKQNKNLPNDYSVKSNNISNILDDRYEGY